MMLVMVPYLLRLNYLSTFSKDSLLVFHSNHQAFHDMNCLLDTVTDFVVCLGTYYTFA
jgi:hypothetical protein